LLLARLLCFDAVGDVLVPRLLTAADHPWLAVLLDEQVRFEGRPWGELKERMGEPLPCPSPGAKRAAAWHVLQGLGSRRPPVEGVKPRELRLALFLEAQRSRGSGEGASRGAILARVASSHGLSPDELERALFADRALEQLVVLADPWPDPAGLALLVNLALVQGLLRKAISVRVRLRGNARAVIRQAQLRRLLCTVSGPADGEDDGVLELSGAYALFRRTTLYGRRLASLVPVLQWSQRFELEARCVMRGRELTLKLATGAPIFPGKAPRRFDSKVEERFAKDFGKLAMDWDLLREPAPIQAGESLVFPDFELRRRDGGSEPWLLEIVGFWSPAYLERKLSSLRVARISRLLLCIDRDLAVAEDDVPAELPVLWYRKKVDAKAVLAWLEAQEAEPRPEPEASGRLVTLGLGELFLDYAGRRPSEDGIHARLAGLSVGDRLELVMRGGRLLLVVPGGGEVAALSQRAAAVWRARLEEIVEVRVERLVVRSVSSVGPGYRSAIRCEGWVVPVVGVRWWLQRHDRPTRRRSRKPTQAV